MLATQFDDRSVVVREVMPQDLKFEMESLGQRDAIAAAHLFAGVVGNAHTREMDVATRRRWAQELMRTRTKRQDAPSWLWTSVVQLVPIHESAYLEHCRQYALETTSRVRRKK